VITKVSVPENQGPDFLGFSNIVAGAPLASVDRSAKLTPHEFNPNCSKRRRRAT